MAICQPRTNFPAEARPRSGEEYWYVTGLFDQQALLQR